MIDNAKQISAGNLRIGLHSCQCLDLSCDSRPVDRFYVLVHQREAICFPRLLNSTQRHTPFCVISTKIPLTANIFDRTYLSLIF